MQYEKMIAFAQLNLVSDKICHGFRYYRSATAGCIKSNSHFVGVNVLTLCALDEVILPGTIPTERFSPYFCNCN